MSVRRQANFLGQQRIDVPAFRAIESSICNDFDVLAGTILAGRKPLVVKGFKIVSTGAATADQLQMTVAGGSVLHFLASESGSIFTVSDDQPVEVLNATNARMVGSFSPNTTNYVGLDFVRTVDDSTADLSMFRDATQQQEVPKTVPQARTIDYRIVISTKDFSSLPSVCPVAKVRTDAGNQIIEIVDARNMYWRLGSGGTAPNALNFYAWPTGRKDNTTGDVFAGADKDITNEKSWKDAIMSRLWELGGGEKWFSPTSDRNLRFLHTGSPFVSTGEYFEWDGTHVHWKGLRLVFENSTASYNAIADQTTNSAGLTNLADGDCLYVDLDRTENRTGPTALVAKKAPLTSLGSGSPPGARIAFLWRFGGQIFTRDQGFSVNSSFKVATTSANGTVQISATPEVDPSQPVVPTISQGGYYQAFAGGISRGNTLLNDFFAGAGDLVFGFGSADKNILLGTTDSADATVISGVQAAAGGRATLELRNEAPILSGANLIERFVAYNDVTALFESVLLVDAYGCIRHRNTYGTPVPPTPGLGTDPTIRSVTFFRTNGQTPGLTPPVCRDQQCTMWWNGQIQVIAESPPY